jgi:hypothetical protein
MIISCFTIAFVADGIMELVGKAVTYGMALGIGLPCCQKPHEEIQTDGYHIKGRNETTTQSNNNEKRRGLGPAILFEQLIAIEKKFLAPGNKIKQIDLIAIVVDVTLNEYQSVLTTVQSIIGESLTLMDIEIVMRYHYRQLNRARESKQGKTFFCGKNVHQVNEYPARDNNKSKSKETEQKYETVHQLKGERT